MYHWPLIKRAHSHPGKTLDKSNCSSSNQEWNVLILPIPCTLPEVLAVKFQGDYQEIFGTEPASHPKWEIVVYVFFFPPKSSSQSFSHSVGPNWHFASWIRWAPWASIYGITGWQITYWVNLQYWVTLYFLVSELIGENLFFFFLSEPGVPIVAQQVKNLTSIQEDMG